MRIGIDLGGTKIEAVLLDDRRRTVWKKRLPTPRNDYTQTINAISSLVAEARREYPAACDASIGVGIPGSLSSLTGLVRNANSVWLNGRPFARDLENELGESVAMANDANCLVLSECTDGAARHAETAFAVILGTGVGGAFAVDGQVMAGANGLAGEWGHVPLPWMTSEDSARGRLCWCQRTDCIETFLSGPALVKEFNDGAGGNLHVASVEDIEGLLHRQDPQAIAVMERFHGRLARALAMVINLLDPQIIVVGGGLSNLKSIYDEVPRRWHEWIFSDDRVATPLVPALHGDASGVRGAASL